MGSIQLDVPWTLIEPEDPSGSDMADVSGVTRKWLDVHCALNHILTREFFSSAYFDRTFGFLDEVM